MSENDLILEPQQALDHVDTETGPVTVRPDSFKDHFLWLQQELYRLSKWEDSYDVPGSEWDVCSYCNNEDHPGIFSKGGVSHHPQCPLAPRKL